MSVRRLFVQNVIVLIAVLSLTGLAYGAPGQMTQAPTAGAAVGVDRMAEPSPLDWDGAGITFPAGAQFASAAKPGLFDRPRGSVGNQAQSKEWEARTLRALGLSELAVGFVSARIGLDLIDISLVDGLVLTATGIAAIYFGYTDLSASRRFFYPDSLLSEDSMKKELLGGIPSDRQDGHGLAFALQVSF